MMVPLAPPPTSHQATPLSRPLLTWTTPLGRAVRLAAPREASSTHSSGFQSASSGHWGSQQAPARPWEQEGAAGPKRTRPGLGQHSSRTETLSPTSAFLARARWRNGRGGPGEEGSMGLPGLWELLGDRVMLALSSSSLTLTAGKSGGGRQQARAGSPSHMPRMV